MHVMPKDDAFYIINVKLHDQGVYTCQAESIIGIIQSNTTLIIQEPPSFIKKMENKDVIQGKTIVLECLAQGSPIPNLKWLKNGHTIDITERHFFAAEQQLLIIVNTLLTDSGIYSCELNNNYGNKTDSLKLTVNKTTIKITPIFNLRDMMGIVIITVFCCAVGTSIIWVIIIYQSKKKKQLQTVITHPHSHSHSHENSQHINNLIDHKLYHFTMTIPTTTPPLNSGGGGNIDCINVVNCRRDNNNDDDGDCDVDDVDEKSSLNYKLSLPLPLNCNDNDDDDDVVSNDNNDVDFDDHEDHDDDDDEKKNLKK